MKSKQENCLKFCWKFALWGYHKCTSLKTLFLTLDLPLTAWWDHSMITVTMMWCSDASLTVTMGQVTGDHAMANIYTKQWHPPGHLGLIRPDTISCKNISDILIWKRWAIMALCRCSTRTSPRPKPVILNQNIVWKQLICITGVHSEIFCPNPIVTGPYCLHLINLISYN